jgi:hypothetical protein
MAATERRARLLGLAPLRRGFFVTYRTRGLLWSARRCLDRFYCRSSRLSDVFLPRLERQEARVPAVA